MKEIKCKSTDLKVDKPKISVIIPCLNEEETIGEVVRKAFYGIQKSKMIGEVIVADNGSTDRSKTIAASLGARVISIKNKGYGSAIRGGIKSSKGEFIVMGDADDSYDFRQIPHFTAKIKEGYELVMGCRLPSGGGKIMPRAMPWKNRWIGNPALSFLGRMFFKSNVKDFHCGLRAFTRKAFDKLKTQTTGMEFASEIVIKATLKNLKISQVPITYKKDGRSRPPHLRPWRDGWRHLRFMLLYSPRWLFLIPGIFFGALGSFASIILYVNMNKIGNPQFSAGTLVATCMFTLVGFQLVSFAFYSKIYAMKRGLLPWDKKIEAFFKIATLERGITLSGIICLLGGTLLALAFLNWMQSKFGPIPWQENLRQVIPACTLILLGVQAFFSCFFLSMLGIQNEK